MRWYRKNNDTVDIRIRIEQTFREEYNQHIQRWKVRMNKKIEMHMACDIKIWHRLDFLDGTDNTSKLHVHHLYSKLLLPNNIFIYLFFFLIFFKFTFNFDIYIYIFFFVSDWCGKLGEIDCQNKVNQPCLSFIELAAFQFMGQKKKEKFMSKTYYTCVYFWRQ